jgi:hypothetical protein
MRFFAGLIIVTIHGAVIAWAALLLGDKGPRYDGRTTLAPWGHVDLVGLVSFMLSGFGWGKPVALDAQELRFGRWGLVIAVLAGSAALLVLAYLLVVLTIPVLTYLPYTAGLTGAAFLRLAARLCVWAALLALVPLPPLAGRQFLAALGLRLPKAAGMWIGWGLLVVSFLGFTRLVLAPAYGVVGPLVLGPAL